MIRRSAASLIVLGAALALVGCSGPPSTSHHAGGTAAAGRHAAMTAAPSIATGATVATGVLNGHGITGAVALVRQADDYHLMVTGFAAPYAAVQIELMAAAVTPDDVCSGNPFRDSPAGDLPTSTSYDIPVHLAGLLDTHRPGMLDPTLLRTVVVNGVTATNPPFDVGTCQVDAAAPLSWTLLPFHLDIRADDRGRAAHATGAVTNGGASYTVAAGDTASAIQNRFGLDADELVYLNPTILTSESLDTIRSGEVFNLDPTQRGARGN